MPYRRKKLTFAISSPDEFLLVLSWEERLWLGFFARASDDLRIKDEKLVVFIVVQKLVAVDNVLWKICAFQCYGSSA